jgi:hypothetical protein
VESLEGISVQDFAITASGTMYTASDREDGLYSSTDDGRSWQRITGNLPAAFTEKNFMPVPELAFTYANALFVGVRGRGLYRYDAMPVGVPRENEPPRAMDLTLWPTLTAADIHFRVHGPRHALVTVHNAMGSVIYRAEVSADGRSHHVDVRDWAPGNYFLRAGSADGMVVRKFVVLR